MCHFNFTITWTELKAYLGPMAEYVKLDIIMIYLPYILEQRGCMRWDLMHLLFQSSKEIGCRGSMLSGRRGDGLGCIVICLGATSSDGTHPNYICTWNIIKFLNCILIWSKRFDPWNDSTLFTLKKWVEFGSLISFSSEARWTVECLNNPQALTSLSKCKVALFQSGISKGNGTKQRSIHDQPNNI